MTMLLRIAERVINRPLLVHPDKLPLVLDVLHGRIPLGDIGDLKRIADAHIDAMPSAAQSVMRGPSPGASRFVGEVFEDDPANPGRKRMLPYRRTPDGVAVITVTGSLINRGAWVGANSGETSYEGIKFQVDAAARDPRASSIILDIESPGGEAVGAFEAADAIRAAAKVKPVIAVVNGMAASAAYALASAATKIVTTQTGLAGSIGVVMLHADYSRQLEQKGINPTLIFAGAHKVDGNPFEPLSAGVRSDLQAEVDNFYALFVKSVAAGRKGLSPSSIRATEARTFIGKDAIDIGLADELGSFESVLTGLSRGASRTSTSTSKGKKMTDTTASAPAANAGSEYIAIEEHKAGCASARSAGKTEGVAEGRKAAHDRMSAIVSSEKVKGKVETAVDLALKSPDMSAEDVVAFVEKLPAAAAASVPSIETRMAGQGAGLALGQPINPGTAGKASGDIWGDAVAKVNKQYGLPAA